MRKYRINFENDIVFGAAVVVSFSCDICIFLQLATRRVLEVNL